MTKEYCPFVKKSSILVSIRHLLPNKMIDMTNHICVLSLASSLRDNSNNFVTVWSIDEQVRRLFFFLPPPGTLRAHTVHVTQVQLFCRRAIYLLAHSAEDSLRW